MEAPDETTAHPPSDDSEPSGPPPSASDGAATFRQRIAAGWSRVGPAAKIAVIVLTTVVVKSFIAAADARARETAAAGEDNAGPPTRRWTNHAGGYYLCDHGGCSKKVDPTIFDHDCCGRCRQGRDCSRAAQRDYDGPGTFAHNYFQGILSNGVCGDCGEPPEAHPWAFDRHTGQRHPTGAVPGARSKDV
jgi:hypothetical protein